MKASKRGKAKISISTQIVGWGTNRIFRKYSVFIQKILIDQLLQNKLHDLKLLLFFLYLVVWGWGIKTLIIGKL